MAENWDGLHREIIARRAALGLARDEFQGVWGERHPWTAPGPLYSTLQDLGSLAAMDSDASGLILCDANLQQFLWRQPCTRREIDALLHAMAADETCSFQVDGARYSTESFRMEWARSQLPSLVAWVRGPEIRDKLTDIERMFGICGDWQQRLQRARTYLSRRSVSERLQAASVFRSRDDCNQPSKPLDESSPDRG